MNHRHLLDSFLTPTSNNPLWIALAALSVIAVIWIIRVGLGARDDIRDADLAEKAGEV